MDAPPETHRLLPVTSKLSPRQIDFLQRKAKALGQSRSATIRDLVAAEMLRSGASGLLQARDPYLEVRLPGLPDHGATFAEGQKYISPEGIQLQVLVVSPELVTFGELRGGLIPGVRPVWGPASTYRRDDERLARFQLISANQGEEVTA
jgi:hypothetical protein